MDSDDLEPRKPVSGGVGSAGLANSGLGSRDLQPLGVGALEEYIADLEAEIARVRAEISRKGSARLAAEAFFRKP